MQKADYPALERPSVLIIDDSVPMLELYAGALQQRYEVSTCSNSRDAAVVLASQAFQLVILEPNVAGSQAWEFLEEVIRTYRQPVIVCSGLENRKSGIAAGAVAYLVKPVLPETLLEVSRQILN